MYYPYSENKGADLRLCFRKCKKPVFSRRGSYLELYKPMMNVPIRISLVNFNEYPQYKYFILMTKVSIEFYYIQSSEIQENIVDIYCIFYIFTSENIKSYIFTPQECTYIFSGLPLTFPLTYCSALQNFKCL